MKRYDFHYNSGSAGQVIVFLTLMVGMVTIAVTAGAGALVIADACGLDHETALDIGRVVTPLAMLGQLVALILVSKSAGVTSEEWDDAERGS